MTNNRSKIVKRPSESQRITRKIGRSVVTTVRAKYAAFAQWLINGYGHWWYGASSVGDGRRAQTVYFARARRGFSTPGTHFCLLAENMAEAHSANNVGHVVVTALQQHLSHIDEPTSIDYPELDEVMQKALREVYQHLYENAYGLGNQHGVSLMVAVIYHYQSHRPRLRLFHIGYSRAFLIRRKQLYSLTLPHTQASRLYLQRLLDFAELASHPAHRIPTRWIGQAGRVNPDTRVSPPNQLAHNVTLVTEAIPLSRGDILLFCSHHLAEVVEEQRLVSLTVGRRPPQAAKKLIAHAQQSNGMSAHDLQALVLTWPFAGQWARFVLLRGGALFVSLARATVVIVLLLILFVYMFPSFQTQQFSPRISLGSETSAPLSNPSANNTQSMQNPTATHRSVQTPITSAPPTVESVAVIQASQPTTPTVAPNPSPVPHEPPQPITPEQKEYSHPPNSTYRLPFRWTQVRDAAAGEVYQLRVLQEGTNQFVAGNNPVIDRTTENEFGIEVYQLSGQGWLLWSVRTGTIADGVFTETGAWSEPVKFKIAENSTVPMPTDTRRP